MKLSILVCSTNNRYNNFLIKMLDELFCQWNSLPEQLKQEVEILTLIDNKTRMLGTKRNNLVSIAQGDYVVFVDDDDKVMFNYITQLLEAISLNPDVVNFIVAVSINGGKYKPCYYNADYDSDFNKLDSYHRLPNHIMCVKRSLALQVPYKDIPKGEDSDYSKRLKPLIQTQYNIDKMLYCYDYSDLTTETQQKIKRR